MANHAPTLEEITQLTRRELTTASKTDPIRECGRAALSLLPAEPDTCQQLAYQKLHDVPYKDVKTCWRRLYTDASLRKVVELVNAQEQHAREIDGETLAKHGSEGKWIDEVVRMLDMALILTGAPQREEVVELWFAALKAILPSDATEDSMQVVDASDRPAKKRKLSPSSRASNIPASFPATLPSIAPTLRYPIPRTHNLSLSAFQAKVASTLTHTPVIIEDAIQHWPALDERPWSSPGYLLVQTLGGRRLVPVEVGKSYTEDGWGQKIVTFRKFMETYMLEASIEIKNSQEARQTGYLAQHDLFAQVPALRADISIPDYCYSDPAPSPHLTHIKSTAKLEEPLLNAWFGPAGTVSPLHTDPYHNILVQVVGYKYVRLYAPEETANLYPRSVDEIGVDMSNTSQVDLDEAMRVWSNISCWERAAAANDDIPKTTTQTKQDFSKYFPRFKDAKYIEGILAPGDCLYLPIGWWHYIRSLTPSFSVSFWFN
ncbi:Clavaminate synthase-like protein [Ophiobolus disseminans]|uniref:Clavaminate synthase-like protein n=1 Tax=Ophiobolus disseminans TaxID=1469910 RepID=A0A6A7ACL8_9PLEO|nr:Clavaminate synthase-like protein [Ophiobolus disseminans]